MCNLVKNKKGITLIALVITIIVLLILAGVTTMTLFGDNGLINMAQKAKSETENAQANTIAEMNNLINSIDKTLGIYRITDDEVTKITSEPRTIIDSTGKNKIKLPKGFKIAEDSGSTVQEGVVIEDSAENQFVWIPVGTVKIMKDGKTESVNIELARYDFTTSDSTVEDSRIIKQSASEYETSTANLTEFANRANPNGVASIGRNGLNAIAKNLKGFVDSVKANGGYYLARYEASTEEKDSTKPASKYNKTTWTSITQINAALASRKMYLNNKDVNGKDVGVESDLINSYAWDTAIIYIEKMNKDNKNYANTRGGVSPSTTLGTGKQNDEVCKIHDMSGNVFEWSTEYSSGRDNNYAYPCVYRGGGHHNTNVGYAACRQSTVAGSGSWIVGFRTLLYVK